MIPMKTHKKAQLGNLFQAVLLLVMVTIAVGLGAIVLSSMARSNSATDNSTAALVLLNASAAITPIATTWMSIIVIVVVVGLIIGILLASFSFRQKQ